MKKWLWTIGLICVFAAAQAEIAQPLRAITAEDVSAWKIVSTALLTPDGNWLAYLITPYFDEGNAEVVVRSIHDLREWRFPAGDVRKGAGDLQMSPSGRWLAFRRASKAVVLVEIAKGLERELGHARKFAFLARSGEILAMWGAPTREQPDESSLTLHALDTERHTILPDVGEFAYCPKQDLLAWISESSVMLRDLRSGQTRTLERFPGASYGGLTWSAQGPALAVFRHAGDPESAQQSDAVITFSGLQTAKPRRRAFEAGHLEGFPKGYQFSTGPLRGSDVASPGLVWRDDEKGLYVTLQPQSRPASRTTVNDGVILWHAEDAKLPLQKKLEAAWPSASSVLGFLSTSSGVFIPLSDAKLTHVVPQSRGTFVLGFDSDEYDRPSSPNLTGTSRSIQRRDYYLVELSSGRRTRVLRDLKVLTNPDLSVEPRLSPDGSVVLFQDGGDYFAYDVASGKRRNLTAELPTRFYYEENQKNLRQLREHDWSNGPVLQGWSDDGKYVLLSDYFDVWALPLRSGKARNLTGGGVHRRVSYSRLQVYGSGEAPTNLANETMTLGTTLYFQAINLDTRSSAVAMFVPGADGATVPDWDDAQTMYYKAAGTNVYLCTRMTATQSGDFYLLDEQFKPVTRLTDVNPQQRHMRWSPGAKFISYTTQHGDKLHAVLHLPVGFISGRSYPTIVSIYERQSDFFHSYVDPSSDTFLWLQRGYAVLLPDIQPRVNEAGAAAIEAVTASVDAAVATGIVDRDRLGLTGHSFGGYETYFIAVNTDLFKAALPEAGYTDLLSDYGSVYERDGSPRSYNTEHEQTYMSGPWWEAWDAFVANSPVFQAQNLRTPLLIMHGDSDRLVPFSQAVEIFNTLRRMGNKQVVLVQYAGEDHDWRKESTRRDRTQRMVQFFDSFLKGAPAPAWWTDGVSYFNAPSPASGALQ